MNEITQLCYGIVLVNIPIYLLLKKRAFSIYLSVLFLGSVAQRFGTVLLWNYSQPLANLFYETCLIVIEISLVIFILIQYLGVKILSEKRFYIFMLTTTIGLGSKALWKSTTTLDIENMMLAFTVLVVLLCIACFKLQYFSNKKIHLNLDAFILFSIGIASGLYLSTYLLSANKELFYISQSILWVAQCLVWLLLGGIYLYLARTRKGSTRKWSTSQRL